MRGLDGGWVGKFAGKVGVKQAPRAPQCGAWAGKRNRLKLPSDPSVGNRNTF